jgi:uncharacterized protein YukE
MAITFVGSDPVALSRAKGEFEDARSNFTKDKNDTVTAVAQVSESWLGQTKQEFAGNHSHWTDTVNDYCSRVDKVAQALGIVQKDFSNIDFSTKGFS